MPCVHARACSAAARPSWWGGSAGRATAALEQGPRSMQTACVGRPSSTVSHRSKPVEPRRIVHEDFVADRRIRRPHRQLIQQPAVINLQQRCDVRRLAPGWRPRRMRPIRAPNNAVGIRSNQRLGEWHHVGIVRRQLRDAIGGQARFTGGKTPRNWWRWRLPERMRGLKAFCALAPAGTPHRHPLGGRAPFWVLRGMPHGPGARRWGLPSSARRAYTSKNLCSRERSASWWHSIVAARQHRYEWNRSKHSCPTLSATEIGIAQPGISG